MKFKFNEAPLAILFFALFIGAFLFVLLGSFQFPQAIEWIQTSKVEPFTTPFRTFEIGLFSFDRFSEIFLSTSDIKGGNYIVDNNWYILFLGFLLVAYASILSLISDFKGIIFYSGIVISYLALYFLQIEQLFPSLYEIGWIRYIVPLIYCAPALALFISGRQAPLPLRLLIHILLFAIPIFIHLSSQSDFTAIKVMAAGTMPGLVLISSALILLIAHEVTALFLEITSRRPSIKRGQNIRHFSLIVLLYLVTLVLYYLDISGNIDFDLAFFNAFFLLGLSIILGLRAIPFRFLSFGYDISPATTRMLYCAFSLIPLSFIGFAFASGNDMYIEAMEDIILFTHIGMGAFFFIYIFINFLDPAFHNRPVYKIVYQPIRMPFFTAVLMGSLASMAIFYLAQMLPMNQTYAGNFAQIAQIDLEKNNHERAQRLLEIANGFTPNNHVANYQLGNSFNATDQLGQAYFFLEKATQRNSTPQAQINLAHNYVARERWFDAILLLNQNWEENQDSHVAFALGNLYAQTSILDSAVYWYTKSREDKNLQTLANRNISAIIARTGISSIDGTFTSELSNEEKISLGANAAILATSINEEELMRNAPMLQDTFAIWNNMLLNGQFAISQEGLLQKEQTALTWPFFYYTERILEKISYRHYYQGNTKDAIRLMKILANREGQRQAKYAYQLGSWAMENAKWKLAEDYFQNADSLGLNFSNVENALAKASNGNKLDALNLIIEDENIQLNSFKNYLSGIIDSDSTYYWQLYFENNQMDEGALINTLSNIDNERIREKVFAEITLHQVMSGNAKAANDWINDIRLNDLFGYELLGKLRHEVLFALKLKEESVNLLFNEDQSRWLNNLRNEQDEDKVIEWIERLSDDIWNDLLILEAIEKYKAINRQDLAYQLAVEAHKENPYSIEILKAYIVISKEQNLNSYLAIGLERLKSLIDEKSFQTFSSQISLLEAEWN